MATNIPIVRQIAWISLIPQMILLGFFMLFFHWLEFKNYFFLGAILYLVVSFVLKRTISSSHRNGMILIKQGLFDKAIPFFEKSVDFFATHKWVDKFRYVVLLSSSKMTYKEMGLCNIAFCYAQIGNGTKALEYYELVLGEYPECGLAKAGMNMLNSMKE
jgi:tetratricopeptide (TPR) repeat protein